jgi:hypothetical protein
MTVQQKNIFVGAPDQKTTGAILSGPTSLPLPEDAADTIDPGYKSSGYVSEDGLKITPSSSTENIKDWSGAIVRKILTEFTGDVEWAHIEMNEDSLKNYFGDDNVTVTPATPTSGTKTTSKLNGDEMPIKRWVFKIKDGVRKVVITVPFGQVYERSEIEIVNTGAIKLGVKLATFPDEEGNSIYVHTDDGVFTA